MKYVILAACALVANAFAVPAFAQEEPSDEARTAETVVVTAGRIPEKAKNVTTAMTVIPQEEIAKNQYQDMSGLLRNYGVQINNYTPGGSTAQIVMRGVSSSLMGTHGLDGAVLLLVDGRRVGTDNITMLPLVNVERIEIIRGPGAVQYGTSAVGGVVNVITRRGTEKPAAMAEAGGGSWDAYATQGSVAWAKGPVDFSGGASYMTAHDYQYGGGHDYPNSGVNYKSGYSLNAGYTFAKEHRIGVTAMGVRADDAGSPGYYNNPSNQYNDRATYSFDVGYEGGCSEAGLSWKGRYFNGRNNYLNDDRDNAGSGDYFESRTEYQGSQGQVSFSREIITLTGGLDWNKYDTKFMGAYYDPAEKSTYDNMGLFLLAKIALFEEKLILSGGLRHDRYNLEADGNDQNLYKTTPAVGIAYHALDWLTLKGNYGESYRVPQAVELLGFTGMSMTYVGNPDLEPEEAETFDVGFEIDHKSFNLGVTYFHTDYKNKIVSEFDWQTNSSRYYNLDGTAKYRGLEVEAGYDLAEAFDWPFLLRPYVNMTKLFTFQDQNGAKIQYVADMDLACGVNFQHPGVGLDVDLRFTYYGNQQVQDWNSANSTYGENVETGGKLTADLYITKTIKEWAEAGKLSLKLNILNIGDVRYETIKDYPLPGRSFFVGLRYDY